MNIPYDLLKDLIYFHDRINTLFEERFNRICSVTELAEGSWSPRVDIYETDGEIFLTAEVPGVNLKDIRIEVADNQLVLKGSRPFPREGLKREDYHRLEGSYGSFERRFPLTAEVDREGVKARLRDGVLKVSLPKLPRHQVTMISIQGR